MWYTLFFEHEVTGIPVMQPMLSQYPRDLNVFHLETQFMLSDKLLVSPVLDRSATWVLVYFPMKDSSGAGDVWYDIDTYQKYDHVGTVPIEAPIEKTPVFQRGGTIIPKKLNVRKSSVHMREDPFSIYVTLNQASDAEGTLYYDDETSFNYREKNDFDYLHFKFTNNTIESHPIMENYKKIKFEKIFFAGLSEEPKSATFMCRSSSISTKLNSSKIHIDSEYLLHVDIAEMNCDYSWSLQLNGAMRNILGSGLIVVVALIHLFFVN